MPALSLVVALSLLINSHYFSDASRLSNDVKQVKMVPAGFVSGGAISSMGISAPPPVENTPAPAPQTSTRIYKERVHVSVNTLPEFNSVRALCIFTVTPYADVRHLLQADFKKWLTVYQVVTLRYHKGLQQ